MPGSFINLRVLVVDDNDDSLCLTTFIFEEYQAKTKTATSVDSAIQAIEEWQPDIVISDIIMPDKDGYSLIRFIRDKEAKVGGFIPVVALTSYVCPEMFNTAMDAGFQKVILNPLLSLLENNNLSHNLKVKTSLYLKLYFLIKTKNCSSNYKIKAP
jgi:CheY-like chemotaxis protein